jgi:hypothetical protein
LTDRHIPSQNGSIIGAANASLFAPLSSLNLVMLIAQTGTQATPSTIAESQGTNDFMSWWWLLPLAAVILSLILYSRNRKAQPKASDRKKDAKSSRISTADTNRREGLEDRQDAAKQSLPTAQQKKRKKEKGKGNRKNTPSLASKTEPQIAAKPAEPSVESVATQPAPSTAEVLAAPKPSIAIFEPLRDASKGRRKASVEFASAETLPETFSRPKEVESLFGGKFERAIPKPSLRTVANRWPQPASPHQTVSHVAESAQVLAEPANLPSPKASVELLSPPPPPPAKGLSSFVSKVKSGVTDEGNK